MAEDLYSGIVKRFQELFWTSVELVNIGVMSIAET